MKDVFHFPLALIAQGQMKYVSHLVALSQRFSYFHDVLNGQ